MTTAARALASMRPMFFGYLWRELSRRKRQAVFIALGLALGVGLVITVTAAADGVRNAQATVLHALYGVGTDLTVTQPPSQGSGGRNRRIIGQVIGESLVIGILGGATGAVLGYAGTAVIDGLAPRLSATVPASVPTAPGALSARAQSLAKTLSGAPHTVTVTLSAPVTVRLILLAVALALAGGLLAGGLGGWRAARLRPAAALARVD
jgi:ABC-type lipoprotein release transport system permease subunit